MIHLQSDLHDLITYRRRLIANKEDEHIIKTIESYIQDTLDLIIQGGIK